MLLPVIAPLWYQSQQLARTDGNNVHVNFIFKKIRGALTGYFQYKSLYWNLKAMILASAARISQTKQWN